MVYRVEETNRGGRVVWVRDDRRQQRLYYAHLDRQLVEPGRRVRVGDTLGLVGNTGNARTTPPHLHFGVYARGRDARGPQDPLPYLARPRARMPAWPGDPERLGSWARVSALTAPLRTGPAEASATTAGALEAHPGLAARRKRRLVAGPAPRRTARMAGRRRCRVRRGGGPRGGARLGQLPSGGARSRSRPWSSRSPRAAGSTCSASSRATSGCAAQAVAQDGSCRGSRPEIVGTLLPPLRDPTRSRRSFPLSGPGRRVHNGAWCAICLRAASRPCWGLLWPAAR